jgi:hypothetical protein
VVNRGWAVWFRKYGVSHPQAKKPNEIMVRNSILPAALNWGSIGSVQGFD